MAADKINFQKVSTNDNIVDMLTKSLPGWKRVQLKSRIMWSDNPNIYWKES